jgi:coproporphyrinogen III oxidase
MMEQINQVTDFLLSVQNKFEAFCAEFNQGVKIEKNSWDSKIGPTDVMISRGEVFEKASLVYCDLEIDTPPVLAEKLDKKGSRMRALVLEIGIHPNNPKVPKAYIELRANIVEDKVILAGGTDIFPYFENEEDVKYFAKEIKSVCDGHGQDYEALRKVRADFFQSKYRKCNVGSHAGIYFFYLEAEKIDFFKQMAETFFDAYKVIIENNKDKSFDQADIDYKYMLHGQWAQWILVEDEGTRFGLDMGIHPDALLGPILPPIAKF